MPDVPGGLLDHVHQDPAQRHLAELRVRDDVVEVEPPGDPRDRAQARSYAPAIRSTVSSPVSAKLAAASSSEVR